MSPVLPQTSDAETEFPLRHYLHIAARRKWTIVLCTFVTAAAGLGVSVLQTPLYQGEAKLVLQTDQADSLFNPQTGQRNDPVRAVATEIQILKSRPVQEAVRKQVGEISKVSASSVGQTDVISVRVRDQQPGRAAQVANAYANAYIEFKRTKAVDSLLSTAREIQTQVTSIQAQADALDAQIAQAPTSPTAGELRVRRDTLIQQLGGFRQQLDQLQVQSRLKNGGAQLVTPAEVPTAPVEPRPIRTVMIGVVLGLLAGLGLAFAREQLDESIRTKDDIERVSADLPVLGIIPSVAQWREKDTPMVISLDEPNSPAAEAYRSLRTSVQFIGLDRSTAILQMTSSSAGEGKTTTLTNLAITLANAGFSVVVVCCDLRRPRVHEFFGLTNYAGFTSVLLGRAPLTEALQDVPNVPGLQLLASGPPPPNPSELLSHPRTGELLQSLRGNADFVLIDSPPVLPVTDSSVLSRWADATIVVVTANQTSRKALHRALELLGQVSAPVIGTVLNGASGAGGQYGYGYETYGYGYDTGYDYGTEQPARRRGWPWSRRRSGVAARVNTAAGRRDRRSEPGWNSESGHDASGAATSERAWASE